MPYVGADGNIVHSKPWTLKSIVDFFWAFIMFFVLFFRGLLHLDDPQSRGQYGQPGRRGGGYAPGVPRRRMGGFTSSSAPGPPPCGAGG